MMKTKMNRLHIDPYLIVCYKMNAESLSSYKIYPKNGRTTNSYRYLHPSSKARTSVVFW
jgi:hypothetical protein